jgi:hypothetical protein
VYYTKKKTNETKWYYFSTYGYFRTGTLFEMFVDRKRQNEMTDGRNSLRGRCAKRKAEIVFPTTVGQMYHFSANCGYSERY